MGLLVDGEWRDQWYDTKATGGAFVRQTSSFRQKVTSDGSSGFRAESGRYHLYVSHACPWAHRTVMMRALKRLETVISLSVVDALMLENGWRFTNECPDTINGKTYLHEIYTKADPVYTGRVTVPVLWDKRTATIVNNESSEIIRMLNSEFTDFTDVKHDFYPLDSRAEIDQINEFIYANVNNGVYKAGFATTQEVYEREFDALFSALDHLEARLAKSRYLVGPKMTEADIRLFTTLIRFDAVYYGHFKCNRQRLIDFPNLSNYVRDLFQTASVSETVDFDHIKRHYYGSHPTINPTRIVPKGPKLNFTAPHDRERDY